MKILQVCKVEPNSPPSQFSLPLTFLDKIWLPLNPTSRLLFYEFPQENYNSSNLVAKLKDSLSHTLKHYLPLAGRLTWPQESETPIVKYQAGDGVSLTLAETNPADFIFHSTDEFKNTDLLYSLLPNFPTSETQSPGLTLQVTLYPNLGFCIGYVAHHAVMDGKSISMFLHSWAYMCKNGDKALLPPELTPYLDRSFVKQQKEFERTYPKNIVKEVDPESRALTMYDMTPLHDTVLGTFILTRENIDILKKSVLAYRRKKNKLETNTRVSTFMISTAYALVCSIKAKQIVAEKTFCGINVNARARLDPPLPSNYFGNCVVWCGGWGNTVELLSTNGFFVAIDIIEEALGLLNDGLVILGDKLKELIPSNWKDVAGFGIAGSPQFELYKVDFGWGKPKKVDMISIDKGSSFYLSDHRDGNGAIEIGIAVKNHEAGSFTSAFANEIHTCESLYCHYS